MPTYFIGGSPCSGKSTIAQALATQHRLSYFKVDDHLDRYLQQGAADGKPACAKIARMTPDQIWMRDPAIQCAEELQIYREIFDYALADLQQLDNRNGVITEGAAWLPVLAQQLCLPFNRYIAITPTKAFQVHHYRQREWVPMVLSGCTDQAAAFDRWMERDALFAAAIRQQCADCRYSSLVNAGEIPVERLTALVAALFGLS